MVEVHVTMSLENRVRIAEGIKRATSRRRPLGKVGDYFALHKHAPQLIRFYEFTAVEQMPVDEVARYHYSEEGYGYPEEFRREWVLITNLWRKRYATPEKPAVVYEWNPEEDVYFHLFRLLRTTLDRWGE